MRNIELIALITANANKTQRIRAYAGPWYTGASRIPDKVTTQIGRVINLIQTKMDENVLCESDEMLLVYNYQALIVSVKQLYCSLSMLIKPLADIENTSHDIGKPFHLIINGITGEVMNNSKGMLMMDLATVEELQIEDLEPPISYGNYYDYSALCSFIAITSYQPITDLQEIFQGKWDDSPAIQASVVFDSYVEARDSVNEQDVFGKYIAEVACPKEKIAELKKRGLGKEIIKIIEPDNIRIEFTPIKTTRQKEASPSDESKRLHDIMIEDKAPY